MPLNQPATATATPTPSLMLAPRHECGVEKRPSLSIRSISLREHRRMLIRFDAEGTIPGPPKTNTAFIGFLQYPCVTDAGFPNSLFCIGSDAPQGSEVTIGLLDARGELIFSGPFSVPRREAPPSQDDVGGGHDPCEEYPPACP
jgi:hypothetical protein